MSDAATLIVKIDYFVEPDARETGRILDRLGLAYSRYLSTIERPPQRLVLLRVEISSWIASLGAFFESAAAATKLIENRENLSDFVNSLVMGLETVRQSNVGQIPAAIRNLLIELATPLNRRRASEVHIHVHGDNVNVFVMTTDDARAVAKAFPKTGGGGGSGPISHWPSAGPRSPKGPDSIPIALRAGEQVRRSNAVDATLNYLAGAWYAHPEFGPTRSLPVKNNLHGLDRSRDWHAYGRIFDNPPDAPFFVVEGISE